MKNFFIYGGCVSRDTYELIKEQNSLAHYVARQSLISATSKPEKRINLNLLSDNFNSRMIKGDIQSSLFNKINQYSNNVDIFLFDILSERLGTYRLSGGTYITNSTELANSGILPKSDFSKTLIRFGSERHFSTWSKSAEQLRDLLQSNDILKKSYLIKANWTDFTIQGTTTPRFRGIESEKANELYERYYDFLVQLGFRTIEPGPEIAQSDENHKWGPSQYHYQSEFYNKIIEELGLS